MTQSGRKMLALCIGASVTLCWLPRTQGQTSSDAASTASARAPVAILILSPHVVGPDETKARAAAELLCDQLAVELSKHAELRVIDRTQLDRLVTERQFSDDSGAASRPSAILAYDMMLRLRVDTGCPIPRTVLELIDLSDGNIVCHNEYLWSSDVKPAMVKAMAGQCVQAAAVEAPPRRGRIRVRFFGVEAVEDHTRLEVLTSRLDEVIREGLARSGSVNVVRHLEAATSKEESLLLLMGMSRLPRGRQFSPQADLLLRMRVQEVAPAGKTFKETPVEISFCLDTGKPPQWTVVRGTLGAWNDLVDSAWKAIAAEVPTVGQQAAVDFLDELKLRRKQAEAELAKITDWDLIRSNYYRSTQRLAEMRDAAAVAAKLDPSLEEAAYLYVQCLFLHNRQAATDLNSPANSPGLMAPVVREGLRFLQRYPSSSSPHRTETIRATGAGLYWKDRQGACAVDADPETLDMLRQVIDIALADPPEKNALWPVGNWADEAYRKMLRLKLPAAQCKAWRDRSLEAADARLHQARNTKRLDEREYACTLLDLRSLTIGHAIEDASPAKAKLLVAGLMEELPGLAQWRDVSDSANRLLAEHVKKLGDDELTARFRDWAPRMRPLSKPSDPRPIDDLPAICARLVDYRIKGNSSAMAVIGEIEDKLYVLFCVDQRFVDVYACEMDPTNTGVPTIGFGCVSLDKEGRPTSQVSPITLAKDVGDLHVRAAIVFAGKVYLATDNSGLLAYDPKKDKWTRYGANEGVPHQMQHRLIPLDDRTMLCIAGKQGQKAFLYTLDVVSHESTLLKSLPWSGPYSSGFLVKAWRDGERWIGISSYGIIDDPLGQDYKLRSGSVYSDMLAVVNGRYFTRGMPGTCEISSGGEVVRRWPRCYLKGGDYWWSAPGVAPAGGVTITGNTLIGQSDSCLFFASKPVPEGYQERCGVVCYDPKAEMWYGPVQIKPPPEAQGEPARKSLDARLSDMAACTSGRNGIWVGKGPVAYVPAADVIEAAKRAGRVMTSDQMQLLVATDSPTPRYKTRLAHDRPTETKPASAPTTGPASQRIKEAP